MRVLLMYILLARTIKFLLLVENEVLLGFQ